MVKDGKNIGENTIYKQIKGSRRINIWLPILLEGEITMYDFTKNEMEIIKDNLMSYIANFGKPRIERGDDGEGFYVFTDNSDSWRQYCYNIDYLNGWLYGCVQAACGNPKQDKKNERDV